MILTPLRPYQEDAVVHALSHDGFAITSEQRTGKTLVAISVVDVRKPDILFVVCPKKAVLEWIQQLERHLDMDWTCDVHIINFEACSRTKDQRRKYRAQFRKWVKEDKKVFLICDEAHKIKKRGSYQSRFMRSIAKLSPWRIALTGTIIAQGIQDAWAVLEFVQPGLLGKWEAFAGRYLEYGGYKGKKIVGYRNEEEFAEILHQYSYRITLNEARREAGKNAVRIRRKKIKVKLKGSSWITYRELEEELETVVQQKTIEVPLVLNLTMKLQQIAGGYLIHDVKVLGKKKKKRTILPVGKEKLLALEKLLSTQCHKKLVICARFIHELKVIARLLDTHSFTHKSIAGGIKYDNKFDTDVIILQIQSGIAIDLSLSNTYIFYSWDHSYINYEQSKFRVLSFDTDQVNYYYLIAEGTIDEDIYEAVTRKKDLATLICDKYRRRLNDRQTKNLTKLSAPKYSRRDKQTYT